MQVTSSLPNILHQSYFDDYGSGNSNGDSGSSNSDGQHHYFPYFLRVMSHLSIPSLRALPLGCLGGGGSGDGGGAVTFSSSGSAGSGSSNSTGKEASN